MKRLLFVLPVMLAAMLAACGGPQTAPGEPTTIRLPMGYIPDPQFAPFYVAVPTSTLDPACPDGRAIPIEERPGDEVRGFGGLRWAADVDVANPAFDVTPADLVTAWVTEHGLWTPPAR